MMYSKKIAAQVKDYFDKRDIYYSFYDDIGLFKVVFDTEKCKTGTFTILYDIRDGGMVIKAFPSIIAPIDDISILNRLLEYMCRINNTRTIGNYSLNFDDGKVEYHAYMFCIDDVVDSSTFDYYNLLTNSMVEAYADGFLSIIFGNAYPEKVYNDAVRSLRNH